MDIRPKKRCRSSIEHACRAAFGEPSAPPSRIHVCSGRGGLKIKISLMAQTPRMHAALIDACCCRFRRVENRQSNGAIRVGSEDESLMEAILAGTSRRRRTPTWRACAVTNAGVLMRVNPSSLPASFPRHFQSSSIRFFAADLRFSFWGKRQPSGQMGFERVRGGRRRNKAGCRGGLVSVSALRPSTMKRAFRFGKAEENSRDSDLPSCFHVLDNRPLLLHSLHDSFGLPSEFRSSEKRSPLSHVGRLPYAEKSVTRATLSAIILGSLCHGAEFVRT